MKNFFYGLLLLAAAGCSRAAVELPDWPPSPEQPSADSALLTLAFRPSALAEPAAPKSDPEETLRDVNVCLVHQPTGRRTYRYLPQNNPVLQVALPHGAYELYAFSGGRWDASDWGLEGWTDMAAQACESYATLPLAISGTATASVRQSFVLDGPASIAVPLVRLAAKATFDVSLSPAMAAGGRIVSTQLFNCTHTVPYFKNAVPLAQYTNSYARRAADPNATQLTHAYYLPENLQGTVAAVTLPRMRSKEYAPEAAAYLVARVERGRKQLDYRIYLGENATDDFNVRRNTHYAYRATIEGENPDDLRVSSTAVNFYAGLPTPGSGSFDYYDKFVWNSRMAYAELNVETTNGQPDNAYTVSYDLLSGTFRPGWGIHYWIWDQMGDYAPLAPSTPLTVHSGNGKTVVLFCFENGGSLDDHLVDHRIEFTVRDKYGYAKSFVLRTAHSIYD